MSCSAFFATQRLTKEPDEPDVGTALLAQSNDEKRNFRVSRSGGRASQNSQNNVPLLPPDMRATEQGARFLPTDHRDTASDDTRQDPSHTLLAWKFCTMNMTAFSTQHFAIFELGCHVCGLQETRLAEAGQFWAREVMREKNWSIVFLGSRWKLCDRPGKRGQVVLRLLQDQVWSCRKAPLFSAQEKALHDTVRYVRALVAYGMGDRVVHVASL